MRTKDEAPIYLDQYQRWVSMQGYNTDEIRCDSDAVFTGKDFKAIAGQFDVTLTYSAPYTPSENSIAERTWGMLLPPAKAMLKTAVLGLEFWEFSVQVSCYIHNRIYSRGVNGVPQTLITRRKPYLGHLRIFGCPAYVHIPAHMRKKLEDNAFQGILVGYPTYSKGYLVFNPTTRRTPRMCTPARWNCSFNTVFPSSRQ